MIFTIVNIRNIIYLGSSWKPPRYTLLTKKTVEGGGNMSLGFVKLFEFVFEKYKNKIPVLEILEFYLKS